MIKVILVNMLHCTIQQCPFIDNKQCTLQRNKRYLKLCPEHSISTWTILKSYWIPKLIWCFDIREGVNGKKTFSFGHCPNHLDPPPMTPIRATWSSFFGSRNSRFESQFRTKNTIYTIWYTVYMQPKNS